ncbi:hypothetical protein ASF93_10095 [Microbacterium sp. Leaf347]|nr:hypothetical protein ASF93_10095 [Microbacterium sp. Leaf347]ODU76817.1 MAG: hypothetical protein ABT08_08255 [Microbacterium sp. SCN 71-21]OJU75585.1 MAG: hypothetical protein BGO15_01215 [Microbacterium sp. 71-23]
MAPAARVRDPDPRPRAATDMLGEPIIELDDVRKSYVIGDIEVQALRGLSLTVREGDYLAVMGPSGSGKSTLMHILGCLDIPTSGSYRLAGDDVSTLTEAQLAEIRNRRIGFVFQQFNLLPSLTAWRNVELPLVYAGVGREERKRRAIEALESVGLGSRIDHRPNELSGGQQQRVSVARALVTKPSLILADEPTGNLDSVSTEDILALFDELHQQGRTVVVITHEHEVADRAAYAVSIRDGELQDPDGVLAAAAIVPAAGAHAASAPSPTDLPDHPTSIGDER